MDDLRTRLVDSKIDPRIIGKPKLDGSPSLGRDEKQQEASAAGPEQLAPERPGFQAGAIHVVDDVIGNRLIEVSLQLPRTMQELAERAARLPPPARSS